MMNRIADAACGLLITPWCRACTAIACIALLATSQSSYGALMVNYQFESVSGTAGTDQTTPDASGNFASTPGTVNAVLGQSEFPALIAGPVQNLAAGVRSRNSNSAMNFPGNPASGSLSSNFERVEIANGSSGALNASFSNFSVALWLNPSNTTRDRFAIGKMGGGGQRGWQIVSPNGTSELVIDYFDAAGGLDRSLHLPNALPLDTWTHVLFAFDGINQTEAVYLNNKLQNSVDTSLSGSAAVLATLNGSNSAAFRVGHRGASGSAVGSWAGGIDDVMILNETLAHTPAGSLTGTGSTLVPEPAACLTFGLGMAGLAVLYRRAKS